jgi:hypothetical protein
MQTVNTPHGWHTYVLQFEGAMRSAMGSYVWNAKVVPRCKFFMWLLLQDRLWTATRLQRCGRPNSCFCQLCYRNLETSQHLFCECPIALKVWQGTTIWAKQAILHPCNWSGMSSLLDWFKGTLVGAAPAPAPGTLALAILITWAIWKRGIDVFSRERN